MIQAATNPAVKALSGVSGRRLLSAMSNKPLAARAALKDSHLAEFRNMAAELVPANRSASPSLVDLIRTAETAMDSAGNLGLTLSFKKVKILDAQAGGFDWGRGEIYVVTSMLDGSGRQPDFKTQLFEGIHDGDFLPLGSGGMLVGMLQNPRWFIDVHMMIMESDDDIRNIGTAIEKARKQSGLADAVQAIGGLAAFDPTMISKVVTTVNVFLSILGGILSENGDDHVATIHDFYLKHQAFGAGAHPADVNKLLKFQDAEVSYKIDLVSI
jgi:hypothetical protein